MYRFTTDELGELGGRRYFLTVAIEPDPKEFDELDPYREAEEWCVTIHRPGVLPNQSDTEIARIDTSHGRPHFDQLFLPDRPKEWLSEEYDLRSAEMLFARQWRGYANQYETNHGGAGENE